VGVCVAVAMPRELLRRLSSFFCVAPAETEASIMPPAIGSELYWSEHHIMAAINILETHDIVNLARGVINDF
jgi:hypothetical protein